MTTTPTTKKIYKFQQKYDSIVTKKVVTIRQVAEVIRIMISYTIAILFGLLFTKQL